jgi:DNA-binding NtrC family response regulator
MRILLSWVAREHDPDYTDKESGLKRQGPTLQLLASPEYKGTFDKLFLFVNDDEQTQRRGQELASRVSAPPEIEFVSLKLGNRVTDYGVLFRAVRGAVEKILKDYPKAENEFFIHESPGMPQAKVVWFLLVKSGVLPAVVLQSVRPSDRKRPDQPLVRIVDLDVEDLPHVRALRQRNDYLEKQLKSSMITRKIVGSSPAITAVREMIALVAENDSPVLITGETGTGKELVARAIHELGRRAKMPFVAVPCPNIPKHLAESELFGHEKGAFTGADQRQDGLVLQAEGGTLFLDEVGDLPTELQPKLLRFLQERSFRRVGGRSEIQSNCRIIAATDVDLTEARKRGDFKGALYERLSVWPISLPPLRERREDIPELVDYFLQLYGNELRIEEEAVAYLSLCPWPGNIRQLENVIRRAAELARHRRDKVISSKSIEWVAKLDRENAPIAVGAIDGTLATAKEVTERQMIIDALRKHNGKKLPAAEELGIDRHTLAYKIRKYRIRLEDVI